MSKRSCKKYDRMIEDYIDGLLSEKKARKLGMYYDGDKEFGR